MGLLPATCRDPEMMDPLIVTQALNVLYGVATLAILVLGLAVILGLLGVLNLAHGELVMIGAYCAYVAQAGGGRIWRHAAGHHRLRHARARGRALVSCGRSTSGRSTRSSPPGA